MRVFAPKDPGNPLHRLFARLSERFFQGALSKAMGTGHFSFPIRNLVGVQPGLYCDYIALNYYTRSTVASLGDGVRENAPVNDLGWEIYPQGIVSCAQALFKLHALPIYVTENGTCDAQDSFRCRYLYDHLKEVSESGLPFQRYYHWCFIDNFEWLEGFSARFGLVQLDTKSLKRKIRRSGEFYACVCKERGISAELIERYLKKS